MINTKKGSFIILDLQERDNIEERNITINSLCYIYYNPTSNIWQQGYKMDFDTAATLRGIPNLQFSVDRLRHATLNAFN